jgi:hypothetical protein
MSIISRDKTICVAPPALVIIYQSLPALTPPHRANTGRDGDPGYALGYIMPRLPALVRGGSLHPDRLKLLVHATSPHRRGGEG